MRITHDARALQGLFRPATLLLLGLSLLGCEDDLEDLPEVSGQAFQRQLQSGGIEREYQLWVPTSVNTAEPAPLIIAVHGSPNGSSGDMRAFSGFDQAAPALQMLVAYPDAEAADWNEDCDCTQAESRGIDDVQFILDMIDHIETDYPIDPAQIYVAGFSQGGLFVQNLVCKEGSRFAAAAVVAATMSRPLLERCDPPVTPMMIIHGSEDPIFPPEGTGTGNEEVVSIDQSVSFWKAANGCQDPPTSQQILDQFEDQTSITVTDWENCAAGGEVEFYEVLGGGHTWPSRSVTFPQGGATSVEIVGAEEIGIFFIRN